MVDVRLPCFPTVEGQTKASPALKLSLLAMGSLLCLLSFIISCAQCKQDNEEEEEGGARSQAGKSKERADRELYNSCHYFVPIGN